MPFTSPIPDAIRRPSALMCALLPRITPPLSQYRNRTSWRPCSLAILTISSGIIAMGPERSLRGRDLFGNDLRAKGELATLHGDDRHALLGHVRPGREGDGAGDAGVVAGRLDCGLDRGRVRAPSPLDRVGHQHEGVVAERRERVLGIVAVLGVVVRDELLDAVG